MKKIIGKALLILLLLTLRPFSIPETAEAPSFQVVDPQTLRDDVQAFLESKKSPLAPHINLLLAQEHWKLLIAISAIESQYCIRQLGNNCWGITKPNGGYKEYADFPEAIVDANGLITRWQTKGRWLTVEDMNCHYVVPCNPTWVSVVYKNLNQLETYERSR